MSTGESSVLGSKRRARMGRVGICSRTVVGVVPGGTVPRMPWSPQKPAP